MKLKQLFESTLEEDLADFFDDCAPYFERCMDVRNSANPPFLFHGTNNLAKGLSKVPFRLRNAGRDTPKHVFDALNQSTSEMFGEEPRRWLFVSSNEQIAIRYGHLTALVFPIGNDFKWFMIKGVYDLYADLEGDIQEAWKDSQKEWLRNSQGEEDLKPSSNDWRSDDVTDSPNQKDFAAQYAYDYLDYRFDKSDFVLNDQFAELFKGDNEIMVHGDMFYAITIPDLQALLKKVDQEAFTLKQKKIADWLIAEIGKI